MAMGVVGIRHQDTQYAFHFAVWPMMLGFCGEAQRERLPVIPARWGRVLLHATLIAGGAALLLAAFYPAMKVAVIAIGTLLLGTCWVAYISGLAWSGRVGAACRWLGERTYSTYLWQQPLTLCRYLPFALHPVGAALAVPLGAVWFRLFERPFLSLGRQQALKVVPE